MKVRAASRIQSRGRWAFAGPSGSGKTWTGLIWAHVLARQPDGTPGRIAVIDSERGSAEKYVGETDSRLGVPFAFDVITLDDFSPDEYIAGITFAQRRTDWAESTYQSVASGQVGYHSLLVDSLSPAWEGHEGVLEQKDKATARSKSKNSFDAWRVATPMHNRLVNALLQSDLHLIVTLRTKTEWVVDKGDDGKSKPRKIGTKLIQRDGIEYEFDVLADMDNEDQQMTVSKCRVPALTGLVATRPGPEIAERYRAWLLEGSPAPQPETTIPVAKAAPAPTIKVETETKPSPEMKRELHGLIRDLGLSVIDGGGAGKPYLVALPVPVLAVLGLPENSPPQDIKTFGLGAYESILPVLRKLRVTKAARELTEAEEGLEADRDAEIAERQFAIAIPEDENQVPDEERGVAT